jgi:hypothetical protein
MCEGPGKWFENLIGWGILPLRRYSISWRTQSGFRAIVLWDNLPFEGADRATLVVAAMRVVFGHCPRDQVPDFTIYLLEFLQEAVVKISG